MLSTEERIAENLQRILERIELACARSGRAPDAVRLIAVTKYAELDWVRTLVARGVRDLGESRPQQLAERAALIEKPVEWHLVGPLQRNKARRILPVAAWIHSVDSLRLLAWIDKLAAEMQLRPRILIELNVAGEESKHGFAPEQLRAEFEQVLAARNIEIAGLMTMAPYEASESVQRRVFSSLRELRDRLVSQSPAGMTLPELSMGMSDDFEAAIEEGSTMVRVGSALFEGLTPEEARMEDRG